MKRALAWRYRHFRPGAEPERWVRVAGLRLQVLPEVFNPALHFTSGFLAETLRRPGLVPPGGTVLDLGTGSGIAAIAAAQAGAGRVVAVDLNPAAAHCAVANVRRYRLSDRVDVREGDLFAPVAGERFDRIVCNPPYFRGTPQTRAEAAYYAGAQYEWLDRFAAGAATHLTPDGYCLLVFGDAADLEAIRAHLSAPGWRLGEVARRDIWVEVLYIYAMTLASRV
jgi:release factor glutamine methyltransferase